MKHFALLMLTALVALPQATVPTDRPPDGPPRHAYERLHFRDGSNNFEYECISEARVFNTRFARTSALSFPPLPSGTITTLTSIVVLTNVATANITAHGLRVGARVTVAGATVDTDLNGAYTVATVPGANSFTFATASVADATYNEATLLLESQAPRDSSNVWAIIKRFYTATALDREVFARGTATMSFACASRTTYF